LEGVNRRGRPRKPRAAPSPRAMPLPFDDDRQAIATYLKGSDVALLALPDLLAGDLGSPLADLRWALPPGDLVRMSELLAERRAHGVSGLADNSRRAMRSDWVNWLGYCRWAHAPVLPALFADVRRFVELLVEGGRKKATVEHHVWTLRQMHRRLGLADPVGSALAADWWRDLVRERVDAEQRQAAGLGLRQVVRVTEALQSADRELRLPRVAAARFALVEQQHRDRALRDVALINVAYDLMMRSAELTGMTWDRLIVAEDGDGTYRLGRTKTDQEGHGATLYLRRETVTYLSAWRAVAPPSPYLFTRLTGTADKPLGTAAVGAIFRRAADLAGLDALYSGHSARVGAAQDMVEAGATSEEVQQAGRWKDARMVNKYAARPLATRAGRNRFRKVARLLEE
jgi:integrase